MPTEIIVLYQFFKVVRHTKQINFDNSIHTVDTSWMHISENEPILVMDVAHPLRKLSEDWQSLLQRHLSLAKALPVVDVLWTLTWNFYEALINVIVVEL